MNGRIAILGLLLALPLHAQQTSPYVGQEDRPLKALSDAEILSYLNGEGMGYAKAAELNRYPGPRHVLDLGAKMGLTESQKQRVQGIYDTMHEKALRLGKDIVSREAVLDSLFSNRTIDEQRVISLVSEIARLQGELRITHLTAHLQVTRILAPDQIMTYEHLRGYDDPSAHDAHAGHGG
jgi:hypothetical protein